MYKILILLLTLSVNSMAQDTLITPTPQGGYINVNPSAYGTIQNRIGIGQAFGFPTGKGAPVKLWGADIGLAGLYFDSTNHLFYVYDPSIKDFTLVNTGAAVSSGRFGIEDNLGIQDRYVDMGKFGFSLDKLSYFETDVFSATDDSISRILQLPYGIDLFAGNNTLNSSNTLSIFPNYFSFYTNSPGVPSKIYLKSSDNLDVSSPARIAVWDNDTLKSADVSALAGATPNLQQVTNVGGLTSNPITINSNNFHIIDGSISMDYADGSLVGLGSIGLTIKNNVTTTGGTGYINVDSLQFFDRHFQLPNFDLGGGSTHTIPVSVNGVFADGSGNITVAGGGSGSQDLQSVTDIGNTTTNPITSQSGIFASSNSGADITSVAFDPATNKAIAMVVQPSENTQYLSFNTSADIGELHADLITDAREWQLPDTSGVLANSVILNGTTYTANSTGKIDIGTITTGGGSFVTIDTTLSLTHALLVTIPHGHGTYLTETPSVSVTDASASDFTITSDTVNIYLNYPIAVSGTFDYHVAIRN